MMPITKYTTLDTLIITITVPALHPKPVERRSTVQLEILPGGRDSLVALAA
jgi:hypothetical protein